MPANIPANIVGSGAPLAQGIFKKYSRLGAYHHEAMGHDKLYAATIQKALSWVRAPASILDIGCGDGVFLKHAGRLGADVCGVDTSTPGLLLAKELADSNELVTGSANHLPFASSTFDMIVMINIVDYLPDCGNAISEVERVLKPGGKLLISSPVDVDLERERATTPDSWQSYAYSLEDIRHLLTVSFELDSTTFIRRPIRAGWADPIIGLVRRLRRRTRPRTPARGSASRDTVENGGRFEMRAKDIDLNHPRLPRMMIEGWELEYVVVASLKG